METATGLFPRGDVETVLRWIFRAVRPGMPPWTTGAFMVEGANLKRRLRALKVGRR
ncbi:hypothetical protein IEQ11_24025 [Lysobacter capsici]|uniref:hypothetical protein n=1 Tax=Lysobacter capsici TaxID=435897 RepID=UPI00177B6E17|nr:hypothetical protein [Lysobacter capsici]UOF14742.1 hypothetical protein IEQ11_24025 [Lysobacter capsici]